METEGKSEIPAASSNAERTLEDEVLRALRGIRFGTVQLTVHEGRVVEIQRTERIRLSACCRPQ
jgi:hypothetical protein